MSFYIEIISICKSINIDFDLINIAKNECDVLDLNTTTSFKTFLLKEKCEKIIEFVKNECVSLCSNNH